MIYVKIFLSLCLIFAIGGSILSFFSKGNLRKIFLLAFPIGYIFLNMAYFELRKNELSSEKSVYSILVFTLVFLLLTIKYKFKIFAHIFLYTWQSFFSKKLIIPLVISLFLATWPYYAIGENFYNHSSNEDFYDGVIGGHQFATLDFKAIIPDFKGHIRYQYSAIGLFETLHQSEGINAYLHNSILNLILIIIGAYFLIHNIFGISNKTALICAFFCFNSTFYFHTYLAGHIGSMMYTSIAPFYVGSIILLTTSSSKMKWAALCTIMSYFLYATYIDAKLMVEGTAVVFILLKIALYFNFQNILYLKDKKINYKRLSILSVVTIFLLLGFVLFKWKDWELIRTYNFETSNSWRIASQKEMIAVFWGLFSPNLAGATSLNAFLADMISLKVTLYSLSFLLFVCYAFFIIKHYRNQKILYLTLYALLFPYLFFVVKYCWGSTYYSYKVLYVNYFLIVTIVILGVQALPIKNLFLKYLQYALFLFVAVLNIFWNLFLTTDIHNRPYHNVKSIKETISFLHSKNITDLTLLIPTEIDQLALANTFRENNIFINANKETKHGLSYSFSNPIFNADSFDYKPIFQNNTFKVYEKPDDQQITINGTYFAQQINDSYFYWKRSAHIIHPTIQSTAKDIMQKFRSKYPHEPLCLDIDDLTFYKNFESANKNDIALINPFASSNYIVRQNQLPNSLKREAESLCFTENAKEEFILKNSRYSIFKTITNHEHVNDTTKTANKFFLKLKTHYGAEKKVVLHPNVPEKLRLILTSIAKVHDFQITDIPDNSSLFINLVPSKQNDDSLNLISEKVDNTSSLIAYKPADHQSAYTNRIYDYKISIIGNYKKKYLNLYFKNGPSIDYESYTVFIANSVKNELISQPIDNNVAGISVPIPTYDQAIEFYVSVRHKTPHLILPYSEDILSVCLTKVVITDKILDERNDLILLSLIQLANAEHHKYTNFQTLLKHLYFNFYNINYASAIIDDNLTAIGTWNPIELYAGEPFRLSSKENIIRLNPKNYKRILFDLEASYPTKQCAVYFSINGQISTKTTTLSARSKIYLDLPINRLGDDEEISISFFTDPNTAFRIFKIKPE